MLLLLLLLRRRRRWLRLLNSTLCMAGSTNCGRQVVRALRMPGGQNSLPHLLDHRPPHAGCTGCAMLAVPRNVAGVKRVVKKSLHRLRGWWAPWRPEAAVDHRLFLDLPVFEGLVRVVPVEPQRRWLSSAGSPAWGLEGRRTLGRGNSARSRLPGPRRPAGPRARRTVSGPSTTGGRCPPGSARSRSSTRPAAAGPSWTGPPATGHPAARGRPLKAACRPGQHCLGGRRGLASWVGLEVHYSPARDLPVDSRNYFLLRVLASFLNY